MAEFDLERDMLRAAEQLGLRGKRLAILRTYAGRWHNAGRAAGAEEAYQAVVALPDPGLHADKMSGYVKAEGACLRLAARIRKEAEGG